MLGHAVAGAWRVPGALNRQRRVGVEIEELEDAPRPGRAQRLWVRGLGSGGEGASLPSPLLVGVVMLAFGLQLVEQAGRVVAKPADLVALRSPLAVGY